MDLKSFNNLVTKIGSLTPTQFVDLSNEMAIKKSSIESQLAINASGQSACPHCGGTDIVRNGTQSGLQRYKCNPCKKTYNGSSLTLLSLLRKKVYL